MSLLKNSERAPTSDLQAPISADTRQPWAKPEIAVVMPVTQTQGNGGAGFDFASESSV
ncbi:hypothetical protein [Solimonas sp. SE-A11]|uniref:hypothetical protein n=1 Tax=Solimonas sp. SE-A11 TaxID=3054954 RepID=UPI00259D30FD|nr:hypothetical protein [Solimonas sp. SE-A11]MDM4772319.1 hypothetical protein [Solimonas sp. SE-A11]